LILNIFKKIIEIYFLIKKNLNLSQNLDKLRNLGIRIHCVTSNY
jgi:hypothetical protein